MTPANPLANWTDDVIGLRLPGTDEVPIPKSNWIAHTRFVEYLIAMAKPRLIVEVGVYTGASLLLMRALAEYHGVDPVLYGIDPWDGNNCGVESWHWDGDETYGRLDERCSSYPNVSLFRMTGEQAAKYFVDGSVDLVHVDADHREAHVRRDLTTWLPKLAPNGLILLHDVCNFAKVCEVWKVWGELTREYPACTDVKASGLGALAPKGVPPGLETILRIY